MARSLFPDPLELLREGVNRFEAGVNALAQRKLANSTEAARTLHKLARASVGVRQLADRSLAGVLALLELPSRSEVAALAAAVQRVEDKLDMLLPASARSAAHAPRPARTRRPPAPAEPLKPPAHLESPKPLRATAAAAMREPSKKPAAKRARRSTTR